MTINGIQFETYVKKVIEKVLMKDLQQRCKLHRVLYFVCLQICESFIDLQFNEWKGFICVFLFSLKKTLLIFIWW